MRLAFDKRKTTNVVSITHCNKLTSLDGLPDVLYGNLLCWYNSAMTSLKGCSKKIYGDVRLAGLSITDLEGGPTFVKKYLVIDTMKSLVSLKGAPGKCKGISFGFVFPDDKVNAYLDWKDKFGTKDNNYPG